MALDLGNLTAGIEIDATRAIATLTDFERKVDDTTQALDGLDKKKVNVSPAGKRELDAAAQSAQGLEKGLDKASAAAGKIKTPTGVAGGLDKAAGSAAGLADELDRAGREAAELSQSRGPSTLDGALGGLTGTIKGLLPQITAVAAAGTVISKGWDRLTGIDSATFKLKGLGHEADSVSTIMDSALTSVKGTAFGLGDAATAAANAVASGVKPGAELTQVLTTMADTAAISGASLQDMGMIFNSVMAKGKLQGDDLLQLMGRGVPVLQMIGDELGITAAEVSKMATEGAISFEIFEKAMREGVGGAAQEMGQSIQGSLQNAGAAIGRLGEAIMGPLMNEGPAAIAGFTEGVDAMTDAVKLAYGAWDKVPGVLKVVIASLAAAKAAQMLLNTEMAKGLALKITDGYASASKGISDFASSLGEAYRNTRLANPEMGALSSGLTVLAGSGGVASTAMGGLKSAAGGLLTALGGPWGLAIGGATVALGLFMKHVADTKQAQQEAEAATQAWADTLSQAGGTITDAVQAHAIAEVQAMDLSDTFSQLGFTTADVAAAALDLDGAYEPFIAQLDRIIQQGTTLEGDARIGQKLVRSEDAQAAMEAKEAFGELFDQIEDGRAAADDTADATNELSMKVADMHRNADDAAAGMDPLIGVFEAMGAEAKTVDEAIKNLTDRMLGLSDDPSLRMQSYLSSAAQDLQKFGDALSGGMGGFDVATGHFDVMTEQGQKLHGTMMDLRTSVTEYASAAYHSYKEMGMSGPEAAAAAADAANGITDSFEQQMLAAGRTQEEVDALIERYGLLPGDVLTQVQAAGIETATDLINGLDERLLHIDQERYTITVDADAISFTQEQAEALGYTWQDIGNNTIQLTADDEKARHAIDDLAAKTEHLGTQDNTIVLRGDTKDVVDRLNEVEGMAAELQTNPATLPVVADTDRAREGIEQLGLEVTELPDGELFVHTNSDEEMQKLLNLGAETVALPEGYIEITDTSAENIRALQTLGVEVRTLPDGSVVITDNAAKVKDNIDRNLSSRVLNRVGTVTMNIIERVQRVFSRSTGGNIPERAAGGSIPKLAAGDRTHGGYRLPMSGPGTERTDGILGIDGRGIPTAWVDRGEFVTNRAATAKWLRTLMAINADDPREVINSLMHELPMLANGGVLSAAEIKDALAHMDNGQYVMGGFSPRQTDCSGGVSAVVNTALGLPTFESRMSTVTQGQWLAAKGFQPGRGDADDIVVGWYDYGGGANGHTSMRLQDGTFIESGGNTGQGFTIGPPAGSLDGRGYTHFMHLPYDSTNDGEGGFLTGDDGASVSMGTRVGQGVNYRAEFQSLDTQDGKSGVGSTFGGSFNVPGLASNASRTVGQSLGGAAGHISGAAGRVGYAGEANALMGMRNPFAGEGTWRGLLGDELSAQITTLSAQLEEQTGRHGIAAEVEAALDGHTPNWDVWLKVSPETIEAFNQLGQAKADRENAAYDVRDAEEALTEARKELAEVSRDGVQQSTSMARRIEDAEESLAKAREEGKPDKIADAEKKLARLREDAVKELEEAGAKHSEEQIKAAENVRRAESKLIQEREKEQKAIADLQRAHAEYSIAMAVAPINAIMDLTSGIVEGTKALADAFTRLDDVIQATNAVVIRHEEAQIRSAQATHGAVSAQQALTRSQRASRRQQHTDILAVQQAEWDLAMARHDASKTAGAAEVDLAQVRQQGIWDVFQTSQQADQAAIMSAHQVALMEAHLSMVKAESAVREQQASYDQQIALIELEFAQREAEVQAQYLAIATAELAMIQGEAAGIAGYGASAMAKKTEGTATKQSGIFGLLGAIAKGAVGVALAPSTGGASLLLTLGAVAEGIGSIGNIASGSAQEKAYAEEAQREFDALPEDIQAMIVAQQAGIPLAAAAGALMGAAGGSRDDVATVQQAVQGAFSVGLDIAIAKAQAELQAAEAQRQREERELAAQERQNRLDELNAKLEAGRANFDQEDTLAEILEVARQQYQEMLQENKQLGELNKNLAPKNQSVLMSIGGSGWGDGAGGPSLADTSAGFGGITAGMVNPWSSLSVEDQWGNTAKGRMWAPWMDETDGSTWSDGITGLPETVGAGTSQALVDAKFAEMIAQEGHIEGVEEMVETGSEIAAKIDATNALLDSVLAAFGVLTAGAKVETQFTGPVTLAGRQAAGIAEKLAEHLARA